MNPTLHAFFVHIPIAVAVLLPFFIAGAILFYRKSEERANQIWYFVTISLVITSLFTIFTFASAEPAEEILEKLVDESAIETHEEVGELFGMLVYIITGLSLFLFIFKGKLRLNFMYLLFVLSIAMGAMALYTGKTGGVVGHEKGGASELHKAIEDAGGDWKALAEEHEEDEDEDEDEEENEHNL